MDRIRDEKDELAREIFAVPLAELCPELEENQKEEPRSAGLESSHRVTELTINHTSLARHYAQSRETSPAEAADKKRRENQELMARARGVRRRKKK